jgi:hypothetical protein
MSALALPAGENFSLAARTHRPPCFIWAALPANASLPLFTHSPLWSIEWSLVGRAACGVAWGEGFELILPHLPAPTAGHRPCHSN